MRLFPFIVVCVLSTQRVNAQLAPMPFPANHTWHMVSIFNAGRSGEKFSVVSEKTETIDGLDYYRIETVTNCDGDDFDQPHFYMREKNGKWFKRLTASSEETLYFDFYLSPGSTFEGTSYTVEQIQSITLANNEVRRAWSLSSASNQSTFLFVEGIGEISRGLYADVKDPGKTVFASCLLNNQKNYLYWDGYSVGLSPDCCLESFSKDSYGEEIHLYPNPAVNYLNVIMPRFDRWVLTIFDTSGRLTHSSIAFGVMGIINTSQLNPGTYILKCNSLSGDIISKRFVKTTAP